MRCFLKNIGILIIIAGVVLLFSYTIQNRVRNFHFLLSSAFEIGGLAIFIITNRFLKGSDSFC